MNIIKAQRSSLTPVLAWDNASVVCGMIVGGGASVGTTIPNSSSNGRGIGDSP